jgi:transcription antitermination factor NusG
MGRIIPGWYLLYTRPNYELKVKNQLEEINISSFCPSYKQQKKWSDRIKIINSPLFPSYIFIYLNNVQDYYNSLKIKGSVCFVKLGQQICRVADNVLTNLKTICAKQDNIYITSQQFKMGQMVKIKYGAFIGMECEIIKFENKESLLVRVELLNRNVLVKLSNEYLMSS